MSIKGFVPEPDTEEAKKLIEYYETCSIADLGRLAGEFGYKNKNSFSTAMSHLYGAKRKPIPKEASLVSLPPPVPEIKIMPAPEIKIKPFKQEGRRGEGEEVQVQLLSDAHAAILTPSYNIAVFRERNEVLFDQLVKLCLLHRKMRPIKKLVVPFLGDMVHGEQYGVQGYVEEFEMGAEQQIYEVLVPEYTNKFVNLLQVYKEIEIYGIPGNHGNIERRREQKSRRSNWDTIFYRALTEALKNYSRIKIQIPPVGQWYMVAEINGWDFLMLHGDMIISYAGVPFYGLERKGLRWKQSIGVEEPFDYMLTGHVHNPNFLWNAGVPTFVNGTMITDSNFPTMRMGLKDVASQWAFFVNRKYGVTASYRINLDVKKRGE